MSSNLGDWQELTFMIMRGHKNPNERKFIEECLTRNYGNKDFWILHSDFGYHIVNGQIAKSYRTKDYHFDENNPEDQPESKRRWYQIEI